MEFTSVGGSPVMVLLVGGLFHGKVDKTRLGVSSCRSVPRGSLPRLTWGTYESSDHLGLMFMYRARDTHKQLIACVGLAISE